MSNLSKELSIEDVQKIADKDDFHISVLRPDGKTYGTLTWIWVVSVDTLFVRAYNGIKSHCTMQHYSNGQVVSKLPE